jgi:hypothetical protein
MHGSHNIGLQLQYDIIFNGVGIMSMQPADLWLPQSRPNIWYQLRD